MKKLLICFLFAGSMIIVGCAESSDSHDLVEKYGLSCIAF